MKSDDLVPDNRQTETLEILLVEDSPADVHLTKMGLLKAEIVTRLHVAKNGEEALRFLRREGQWAEAPTPGIVLLDLNLPGMAGHDVLVAIRSDPDLEEIPVVVLTTSDAAPDIAKAYDGYANAYLTKPVDFSQFHRIAADLTDELFTVVKLAPQT